MTDFNGWSNRETWLVALHYANNEYDYERLEEIKDEESKDFYDSWPNYVPGEPVDDDDYDDIEDAKRDVVSAVADRLKDMVESDIEELLEDSKISGFISDAIYNTVSEVDWYEWAENLLEF